MQDCAYKCARKRQAQASALKKPEKPKEESDDDEAPDDDDDNDDDVFDWRAKTYR